MTSKARSTKEKIGKLNVEQIKSFGHKSTQSIESKDNQQDGGEYLYIMQLISDQGSEYIKKYYSSTTIKVLNS